MSEAVMQARRGSTGFQHLALFYADTAQYVDDVTGFIRGGLTEDSVVFVAVPGPKLGLLRDALGADAREVSWADMTTMGHNPAWIIPRVRTFLDSCPDRTVRYVGEPIWASRSSQEIQEATRHEALINLAFEDTDAAILCPYDLGQLDAATLANAEHTHPVLVRGGQESVSLPHLSTRLFPPDCDLPLPPPPADAVRMVYREELPAVRALVADQARRAGLAGDRIEEVVLVVNELATNTLHHTAAAGLLQIWHTDDALICQIEDQGHIADPLVGRRRPMAATEHGHGTWLAHQLCDLVELRSHPDGTTFRLHIRPIHH